MKWPMYPFEKVAEVVTGNTPPKSEPENYGPGVPWVKPPDLDAFEPITCTDETLSEIGQKKARLLPAGSVMVCCIASIGKVGIAGTTVATNQQINSLNFRSIVEPRFGYYYCRHIPQIFQANARHAVVPILNKGNFQKIEMPVPSLSEQRRIVEILDQADQLRKLRASADKKAERILPALFNMMFGDPATNPMGWEREQLVDLSLDGPQYGANASSKTWQDGLPRYVRITDIQEDGSLADNGICSIDLDNWKPFQLEVGDLLFARSGNTVGKTYLFREQDGLCAFAGYLIRFKLNPQKVNPWFAFAFTLTKHYKNWVASNKRAAGQPNINGQEYSGLLFPKPPINLQNKFGTSVEEFLKVQEMSSASRKNFDSLFSLLLQQAFSGTLTASWREAHMKELLAEMEQQAKYLNC